MTFLRWGDFTDGWNAALAEAGFPGDDEEPGDEISRWTASQCAALALEAITGVTLDADVLDGPWLGGLSSGPPR